MKTCKSCGRPFGDDDNENYEGYGWHPMFGDCYLCFCCHLFGGALEPMADGVFPEIYEITAPRMPPPYPPLMVDYGVLSDELPF